MRTVSNERLAELIEDFGDDDGLDRAERDIGSALRELQSLRAEVEGLRKDAERWRWWRTRVNWRDGVSHIATARTAPILSCKYREWVHYDYRKEFPASESVDEYIDAAIDKTRGE